MNTKFTILVAAGLLIAGVTQAQGTSVASEIGKPRHEMVVRHEIKKQPRHKVHRHHKVKHHHKKMHQHGKPGRH